MELRAVFDLLDLNRSGGISLEEVISALPLVGIVMSRQQITKMFDEADVDGSGEIDFEEFEYVVKHADAGGGFAQMIRRILEDARIRALMSEHNQVIATAYLCAPRSRLQPLCAAPRRHITTSRSFS